MASMHLIATSVGGARITIDSAAEPRAVCLLGHGAGGGISAPDLVALSKALPPRGITVVRVEQPYRVAGKRGGPRPEILDTAWREVVAQVQGLAAAGRESRADPYKGPLNRKPPDERALQPNLLVQGALQPTRAFVVGGRSAGARVACRTAKETGAAAVVALAFPLHPPGRPEKSRAPELLGAGVPTLVIQGDRDPFGKPEEFPPGDYRLHRLPGADHGFAVPKSAQPGRAESLKIMADTVGDWLRGMLD